MPYSWNIVQGGEELVALEGLYEIAIGAKLRGIHHIRLVIGGGQHNHRGTGELCIAPDFAEGLEAILTGHVYIKKHNDIGDIIALIVNAFQRGKQVLRLSLRDEVIYNSASPNQPPCNEHLILVIINHHDRELLFV
jgi:hypothetical protein